MRDTERDGPLIRLRFLEKDCSGGEVPRRHTVGSGSRTRSEEGEGGNRVLSSKAENSVCHDRRKKNQNFGGAASPQFMGANKNVFQSKSAPKGDLENRKIPPSGQPARENTKKKNGAK